MYSGGLHFAIGNDVSFLQKVCRGSFFDLLTFSKELYFPENWHSYLCFCACIDTNWVSNAPPPAAAGPLVTASRRGALALSRSATTTSLPACRRSGSAAASATGDAALECGRPRVFLIPARMLSPLGRGAKCLCLQWLRRGP